MRKAKLIREQIIRNNRLQRDFPIDSENTFSVLADRLANRPRPQEVAPIIAKLTKVAKVSAKVFIGISNMIGRGSVDFIANAASYRGATLEGIGGWEAFRTKLAGAEISLEGVGSWLSDANAIYASSGSFEGSGSINLIADRELTIFQALDYATQPPSVDNLEQTITLNSTPVTPDFVYEAFEATTASWVATVGTDMVITGSGTDPGLDAGSPLFGINDTSVQFQGTPSNTVGTRNGKVYAVPNTSSGDITLEDYIVEAVFEYKAPDPGATSSPFGKWRFTGGSFVGCV